MTPSEIHAAAAAYLAGFDSPTPITAIAEGGTSEEDDRRLEHVYGEDWPAVALEIERRCRVKTGWPRRAGC